MAIKTHDDAETQKFLLDHYGQPDRKVVVYWEEENERDPVGDSFLSLICDPESCRFGTHVRILDLDAQSVEVGSLEDLEGNPDKVLVVEYDELS